jgi:16S rRNA A1518/A1519 N6-dimethyltransferase RsmA/KsgA/DIM1 with predicted DNA glycosylase/AP lyase activity
MVSDMRTDFAMLCSLLFLISTTDYLRTKVQSLTALERDPVLAEKLHERFRDSNVRVIEGDATAMPFENG